MARASVFRAVRGDAAACMMLLLAFAPSAAAASECAKIERASSEREFIVIGKAWSGARVTFDGVVRKGKVYIGYYDEQRYLTVAEIDKAAGKVCRTRLASQFGGWDDHNAIALAFDQDGHLHVSGNMHATSLVYGRTTKNAELDSLAFQPMVGRDEARVTYPTFLHDASGRLLFLYRSGGSGDGAWFANRFDGGKWERLSNEPLFTNRYRNEKVSAYPSPIVRDAKGVLHVAVVWRANPNAASNFAVSYAMSRDLLTWTDRSGQPISLPLSPGNMETVEATGQNACLLNSAKIFFDASGNPIVGYTRYDGDTNVVILARPGQTSWSKTIVARSENLIRIEGVGFSSGHAVVPRLRSQLLFAPRQHRCVFPWRAQGAANARLQCTYTARAGQRRPAHRRAKLCQGSSEAGADCRPGDLAGARSEFRRRIQRQTRGRALLCRSGCKSRQTPHVRAGSATGL